MSSILTNNSAMNALQTLRGINKGMSDVQQQINTGKHIANAKDNAAIWGIAATMETDVSGFKAVSESLNLGTSTLGVARNAAEDIQKELQSLRDTIISAQTPGIDRLKTQQSLEQKVGQIQTIVETAQFNGVSMLKGNEDVAFLASMSRTADGTVTTNNITVQKQDLTTKAAVFGTSDGAAGASATNMAVAPMAAGGTNGVAVVESIAANATTSDITGSITVAGVQVAVTVAAGATQDEAVASFASAINGNEQLKELGITAGGNGTAGELAIATTNKFDNFKVTNVTGSSAALSGDTTLERRSSDVDLTNVALTEGEGFRIQLEGQNFDYVAKKGDTMTDVAKGFESMINGNKTLRANGVEAKLDLSSGNPKLMIGGKDGAAPTGLTVESSTGANGDGTAAGGLNGLESLDVTTEAGAKAALGRIEGLIQNTISSAAAIGAAQGRMESQTSFVKNVSDGLKSGVGALVDADMEAVSARLQALQVQQQLGVQALSIANQQPQSILSLFR